MDRPPWFRARPSTAGAPSLRRLPCRWQYRPATPVCTCRPGRQTSGSRWAPWRGSSSANCDGQSPASARATQAASVCASRLAPGVTVERAQLADPVGQRHQLRRPGAQPLVAAAPRRRIVGRRLPDQLLDCQPPERLRQPLGLAGVGRGHEHVGAGPQPHRMHPLDGQAGLSVGARPVDLPVMLDPKAVQGHPYRRRPQRRGRRQQLLPVLADRQRRPGGGQRLELGRTDMLGEHPQQLRRLRVGGHLVHRVGAKAKPMVVAEPVGLLQHPGHVVDRHRRIGDALGPAVPAHHRAAHPPQPADPAWQPSGHQYLPDLAEHLAELPRPRHQPSIGKSTAVDVPKESM